MKEIQLFTNFKKVINSFSNLTIFLGILLCTLFNFMFSLIVYIPNMPLENVSSRILGIAVGLIVFLTIFKRWGRLGIMFRIIGLVFFVINAFLVFECIRLIWLSL